MKIGIVVTWQNTGELNRYVQIMDKNNCVILHNMNQ